MSRTISVRRAPRRVAGRRTGAAATAVLIMSLVLAGCGIGGIGKVINAVHALADAARSLRSLQSEIQKGEKASYEATYETIGSGGPSSVITFAQEPGGKYAFTGPGTGGSGATDVVGDGNNQYACSQSSGSAQWTCLQSAEAPGTSGYGAAPFFDFTGAFVYGLAEALEVEAAIEGFKVTNSTTSVNGIPLKCVSLRGKVNGQVGDYEWCVTANGILGLAKYAGGSAGDGSSFEITKLNTSPASSIFEPPSGASITTLSTSTT